MTGPRWKRLKAHFRGRFEDGSTGRGPAAYPSTRTWRLLEAGFLLADLVFVPEILLSLNRLFKPNTRRLNEREIAVARAVFGETIDYHKVRIDERAMTGCRQYGFAYVGFNCINCWGKLSDAHFVHEMVHIWQFQTLGSRYIPRALWAQRTPEGYNYGGVQALQQALREGRGLSGFNFEQQGDVVADYFCLQNGLQPRWCDANPAYLPVFEAIVKF